MHKLLRGVFCFTMGLLLVGCGSPATVPPPASHPQPTTVALISAKVTLPTFFSDHMILQRDKPINIWGWSDRGAAIRVAIADQVKTSTTDQAGRWQVTLDALPAGGPHELTINNVTIHDVLVGEVWICSGQSNMEWTINKGLVNKDAEIAAAKFPNIRTYGVKKHVSLKPLDECDGYWQSATPEHVGDFSAVAYFFARHLHQQLNVPIGLIHTSWGGTPAEAWTSYEALASMSDFQSAALTPQVIAERSAQYDTYLKDDRAWQPHFKKLLAANAKADPQSVEQLPGEWKQMKIPTAWEDAGLANIDGIVWFKRSIDLPQEWRGKELSISLGKIEDNDITFVNGQKIGATDSNRNVRSYKIPAGLNTAPQLQVLIRVLDASGKGGLVGPAENMKLELKGAAPMSLTGTWQYKLGAGMDILPPRPQLAFATGSSVPGNLFNGMINPLIPYGIRGAIWYQGEANTNRAIQYRTLLPTMIADWRKRFGQGDFPFGIVQLANFRNPATQPGDSTWAELREAQAMTAAQPNNGLAVAIDIGETKDIHPKNKQDVGLRLALWAEAKVYGKSDVVYSGPMYKSMKIDGSSVRIHFDHVGGGLVSKDGKPLRHFAVAGEDRKFVWADAKIEGDEVVLSATGVTAPVAVRYAWADNPLEINFYNRENLPAVPFRTDDWNHPEPTSK